MASLSRRKFLAAGGAAAAAAGLYYAYEKMGRSDLLADAIESIQELRPPAGPPPNVLMLIFDDLGAYLGTSASTLRAHTPHLDALAARGIVFDRAYCPAPLCNPSRAAMFTGVPPWKSGVYHNDEPWRNSLPDAVTLPEYFARNGYSTYGGGKIFHVMRGGPQFEDTLFDERFAKPDDPITRDMYHTPLRLGPLFCDDHAMGDYKVASWAARRIAMHSGKPFFMATGIFRPHGPMYIPQKYFDMYPIANIEVPENVPNDLDDVPERGRHAPPLPGDFAEYITDPLQQRRLIQAYLASVSFADACAGRVLEMLKNSAHAQNTIVIALGDNGMSMGQKNRWFKSTLWEEATRVPLIIAGPGVATGQRCTRPVSLQDIYPTLLDMCRLPAREDIAGRSLRKLLKRPDRAWDHPVASVMGKGNGTVKSEQYSYIRYDDNSEELYDLAADPGEVTNLASRPELAGLKRQLAAHLPDKWADEAPRIEKEEW